MKSSQLNITVPDKLGAKFKKDCKVGARSQSNVLCALMLEWLTMEEVDQDELLSELYKHNEKEMR